MAASASLRLAPRIFNAPLRFIRGTISGASVDQSLRSAILISSGERLAQKPIFGESSVADRISGLRDEFLFSMPGVGDLYCARPERPVTGGEDDSVDDDDVSEFETDFIDSDEADEDDYVSDFDFDSESEK